MPNLELPIFAQLTPAPLIPRKPGPPPAMPPAIPHAMPPAMPAPHALAATVAAEAEDLAPFVFWRLQAITKPHPDALRQVLADAFVLALQEHGAVLVSRSLAEIRAPGGPVYEHFNALVP